MLSIEHSMSETTESLTIDQILALLAETPPRIAAITAGLTPAQLDALPAPDEWSASDVLAHLRSCADVWGNCIATLLERDNPTVRVVSPRTYIKKTNYRDAPFQRSLSAFAAQRASLLKALESLAPDAWSRTATVKRSGTSVTETVLSFAIRLAVHERHHLGQFARIVDAVRASS
jgi:hypothetical protein